ncbi:hypothetical protein [Oceanobacillus sp. FSL H7-0719]|uniref:hypothetical protein n=1 Tax=Oceanobacillus sp. FSL H7-0719 TaxID=2954507 RepID=UPI00324E0235
MRKRFISLLLLFGLLLSACNANDELSGRTFEIATHSPEMQIEDSDRFSPIVTLNFSEGNVFSNPIYGEGTYELNDNVLVLHYENENESLNLRFELSESDNDYSEYAVEISGVDFEMKDLDKVSHYEDLPFKFDKNSPMEFIERKVEDGDS